MPNPLSAGAPHLRLPLHTGSATIGRRVRSVMRSRPFVTGVSGEDLFLNRRCEHRQADELRDLARVSPNARAAWARSSSSPARTRRSISWARARCRATRGTWCGGTGCGTRGRLDFVKATVKVAVAPSLTMPPPPPAVSPRPTKRNPPDRRQSPGSPPFDEETHDPLALGRQQHFPEVTELGQRMADSGGVNVVLVEHRVPPYDLPLATLQRRGPFLGLPELPHQRVGSGSGRPGDRGRQSVELPANGGQLAIDALRLCLEAALLRGHVRLDLAERLAADGGSEPIF